ncbi:hypothetical protein EHS25_008181 [Saitozyma podzolica]|uniref:J domain-containing protein n=1 Tax=Saitozyma podzolica TaxID=1890683 RepID=A0A427YNS5_9TREE|nr:hypothetical protein EHS25_008181 [Saitozyma podzolica]
MSTVDSVLSRNANDLAKQLEVERIMKAFKLNPYDILDLPFGASEADVKKQFRKKSLLIHPDKYKHEQGHEVSLRRLLGTIQSIRVPVRNRPQGLAVGTAVGTAVAFDFMKKAEGQLSEPSKRAEIDAIMTHSRTLVLKSILGTGYSIGIADTDPRLANLTPSFDLQIRAKAKEVLIEDELSRRRKQKLTFANEGAEKAKQEAEVIARKRKVEDQAKWEERREDRIKDWRDFSNKKKKVKKNAHVLG